MTKPAQVSTCVNAGLYFAFIIALLCFSPGCESARDRLPALPPRLMLDTSVLDGHPLEEGSQYQLLTLQETTLSSLHIFRLRTGTELLPRYHKKHDLIILCMEGSAILTVEDDRYFLKPGTAAMVPNYRVYSITHHGSEKAFVAGFAFAPAYDPDDIFLIKGKKPRDLKRPTGTGEAITEPVRKRS